MPQRFTGNPGYPWIAPVFFSLSLEDVRCSFCLKQAECPGKGWARVWDGENKKQTCHVTLSIKQKQHCTSKHCLLSEKQHYPMICHRLSPFECQMDLKMHIHKNVSVLFPSLRNTMRISDKQSSITVFQWTPLIFFLRETLIDSCFYAYNKCTRASKIIYMEQQFNCRLRELPLFFWSSYLSRAIKF